MFMCLMLTTKVSKEFKRSSSRKAHALGSRVKKSSHGVGGAGSGVHMTNEDAAESFER